ncbi:hypothetical protein ACJX0J_038654 [Zea mays]
MWTQNYSLVDLSKYTAAVLVGLFHKYLHDEYLAYRTCAQYAIDGRSVFFFFLSSIFQIFFLFLSSFFFISSLFAKHLDGIEESVTKCLNIQLQSYMFLVSYHHFWFKKNKTKRVENCLCNLISIKLFKKCVDTLLVILVHDEIQEALEEGRSSIIKKPFSRPVVSEYLKVGVEIFNCFSMFYLLLFFKKIKTFLLFILFKLPNFSFYRSVYEQKLKTLTDNRLWIINTVGKRTAASWAFMFIYTFSYY